MEKEVTLKSVLWLIIFNLLYILPFTIFFLGKKNWEFIGYIAVLIFLLVVIYIFHKKYRFSNLSLWGLSIWGLLHLAGGGIRTSDGVVLYGLKIFKILENEYIYILRYDQLVHFYLYFIMAFIIYDIIKKNWGVKENGLIYLFVVLVAAGIGSLNEVIEFFAYAFLENVGVGNYYNNSVDLIANTIGAIMGAIICAIKNKK